MPSESQARSASPAQFEETFQRREGLDALDRIRLRRKLAQRDARGTGRHQRDVARRLGQRHQRDAAAVAVGIGDQLVRRLDPRVPARGQLQPSSSRITSGGACLQPPARIPDRSSGREDSSAAAAGGVAVSHHGVRAGVSSFGAMSNSSRVGGNRCAAAAAASRRSSHHSAGRLSRPNSSNGSANASGRPAIMRHVPQNRWTARAGLVHGHAGVQEQQQFGRGAAGGVGREQPVEPSVSARIWSRWRATRAT